MESLASADWGFKETQIGNSTSPGLGTTAEAALAYQLYTYPEHLRLQFPCQYDEIIAMENDYPIQLTDEFSAIFAHAFLSLSKSSLEEEDYTKAAVCSQKSIEYSQKGIYANATIKSEGIMILNQSADKLSKYYK